MLKLSAALVLHSVNGFVVDVLAPPLCNFAAPANATTGTSIPICIFLMSAPKGDPTDSASYVAPEVKSIAFSVPMDEYAMLTLPGSFDFNRPETESDRLYAWATGSPTVTAWARECALPDGVPPTFSHIDANITSYSCPQLYMTTDRVAPLSSLVAVVENGVLQNLIWDNHCDTCSASSDECIGGRLALTMAFENSSYQQYLTENPLAKITDNKVCSVRFDQCHGTTTTDPSTTTTPAPSSNSTSTVSEDVNCDLRVLLTWVGTDADGKRLTSGNNRISKFSSTTAASMWDSVATTFGADAHAPTENTIETSP